MERRHVLLLAAAVVVATLAGSVGAACPDGFQQLPYGACVKLFPVEVQFGPSWVETNEHCKKEGGQLISLDTLDKMVQFSMHLYSLGLHGDPFCVGARKTAAGWSWLNGAELSLQSNMWLPNQPEGISNYTRLIPMSKPRHYLSVADDCRGYACEASQV